VLMVAPTPYYENERTSMIKKFTAFLLVLVMCLSLVACGGDNNKAEGEKTEKDSVANKDSGETKFDTETDKANDEVHEGNEEDDLEGETSATNQNPIRFDYGSRYGSVPMVATNIASDENYIYFKGDDGYMRISHDGSDLQVIAPLIYDENGLPISANNLNVCGDYIYASDERSSVTTVYRINITTGQYEEIFTEEPPEDEQSSGITFRGFFEIPSMLIVDNTLYCYKLWGKEGRYHANEIVRINLDNIKDITVIYDETPKDAYYYYLLSSDGEYLYLSNVENGKIIPISLTTYEAYAPRLLPDYHSFDDTYLLGTNGVCYITTDYSNSFVSFSANYYTDLIGEDKVEAMQVADLKEEMPDVETREAFYDYTKIILGNHLIALAEDDVIIYRNMDLSSPEILLSVPEEIYLSHNCTIYDGVLYILQYKNDVPAIIAIDSNGSVIS